MPKTKVKPATVLEPDVQAMERQIRRLHSDGPFTYQVYGKSSGVKPDWKHVPQVCRSVIAKLANLTAAGAEIAIVPNVMDGEGRRRENCTAINWLFADCDSGHNTVESLLVLPVRPNLIVETSAGHLQPYWRVEGCSVEQFSAVQNAIALKLGEDSAVSDPSRCMRLAGTLNNKRGKPELVTLVYPAKGKMVSKVNQLQEFCTAMGLDLESKTATKATNYVKGSMSVAQVKELLTCIDAEPRDIWRQVGMALHSEWPDDAGYKMWTTWSKKSPKFDAAEQKRTWDGFKPDGGITLGTLVHLAGGRVRKWDERGFADAVVEAGVGKLGFDPKTCKWWRFTGVRWESGRGDHQALKFVRDFVDGLAHEREPELIAQIGSMGRMSAAVKQAQLDDRIAIDEQQFDADPYLLGVKNGVVDLRTGVFRAAVAADKLTRCCAVDYDPDAKCPEFRKFLHAICMDREPLGVYLIRALGYTITGDTKEQKLFIPIGEAANGKGVLMNLMETILGSYAISVSPMLLMRANSGNPNAPAPALMRLRGARMFLCTELQEGKPFDEAFIKQLTGGDTLTGREGYGQQTEFKVVGKLWVSSNHDPEIAYGAVAMWRRLRAIPFDAQFIGAAEDTKLREKLLDEAPGILALIVRSARRYVQKPKLPQCSHVDEATAALRDRLDSVKQWLDHRCREVEGEALRASDAHKDYVAFCKASRRTALPQPAFKAAMLEKGIQWRKRGPANYYFDIRLVRG